ncbi:hypothetical protein EUTSA_v10006812mg [Eutrema salsugineum]|uniref:Receptor-like serine/threonine-protein kinase n=1 Tax=Eutrema salsugineum TaxID=72664 RepID=V4L090_EUTSA|nr:hypothetical protein EUTSA_v10006812mg [Eutrema salsugineum]
MIIVGVLLVLCHVHSHMNQFLTSFEKFSELGVTNRFLQKTEIFTINVVSLSVIHLAFNTKQHLYVSSHQPLVHTQTQKMKIIFVIFFFSFVQSCISSDTLMRRQSLRDGDVILSQGKRFAFGFFSLGDSKLRYVGIWYAQISEQTIVWVANRNHPVNDTSGLIKFNRRGNLCVCATVSETEPLWSTNVSDSILEPTLVARLSDLGNLVLLDSLTGRAFWQSFDHPTDTFLPYMRLGFTRKDGLDRFLTSWRSPDDPGSGNRTFRMERRGFPQLILYRGQILWWRTGSWTGQRWSGVPEMIRGYIFNNSFVNDQEEVSFTYGVTDSSVITRLIVNERGNIQRFTWIARDKRWNDFWSVPKEECDYYAHCGVNGHCDPTSSTTFECTCLPGFEPKIPRHWFLRDYSGGCVKKKRASLCREKDGFVKLKRAKIPHTSDASVDMNITLKECKQSCLKNCSCVAYASAYQEGEGGATGCLTWHGDMLDTRTYLNSGQDFYIRVDAEELDSFKFEEDKARNWELPLFELNTIAAATNNFSSRNKLGAGGFGPVYKYRDSGEEVVEKLRPRNGGVQERGQAVIKIAASKSNEEKRAILDWQKRMKIICGIARGILYLHQDSRLRIIHRDLKASNVLLDNDMIPKIADFGMARIFGGNQIEGNTNRVVGTYGYMSPEYAMEGHFSVKSDVYSFGVLILEIITGLKNNAFHEEYSTLIGHIWDLWNKGEAKDLIDTLMDQEKIYDEGEVMKCIHIGLLCVQENASDRPDMSSVIFMLGHNAIDLPSPKHPVFTAGRKRGRGNSAWLKGKTGDSVNDITLTDVQGR